jgi:phosphatidylinositol-3-phosphatase
MVTRLEFMRRLVTLGSIFAVGCARSLPARQPDIRPLHQTGTATPAIQTIFIILMENHDWGEIVGSESAPYINNALLPLASYTDQYLNPPHLHPSLPNYLWLEAGDNFGIFNDANPDVNHQSTTDHLVSYLEAAGVSWKTYQEGITGNDCPLVARGLYAPRHNPFIYFDDTTDGLDSQSPHCIASVRPYDELAADLVLGNVAQYVFITPDNCHDMHDSLGCETPDPILNGDLWLAREVPNILASNAYNHGALFITWDEGTELSDGPIGMIVLSPLAIGGGYHNAVPYTHSSFLRTAQEVFNVGPLLRDAANATSLSDLFATYP